MLALGKPGALFVFDLCVLVGYAGVILWASDRGLETVCIAVMLFQFAILAAQYSILERRYLGVPLRVTWGAIVPASVSTAVALLLALPAARVVEGQGPDMLVAGALAAVVLSAYAVTLRVGFHATWSETLGTASAVIRRPRRRTPAIVQPASRSGPQS
jgi:hypothetical protein